MRVVELLLPRLYVHVGISQLAEIDFGPGYVEVAHRALDRHIAQNQGGQAFRRESIYRIHGDAIAVGVDQLLVDPVAAAFRKFFDIQFARCEHYLASGAVDFIAIDVDVREIVVGADFLNLAQRILKRAPVPQPDVLQRSLIVLGISSFGGSLGGKFALRDPVQSVGLPRQVRVVNDVGLLANQFVRFDDKAAHVPTHDLEREITNHGGNDRSHQPASALHRERINGCEQRAGDERGADHEHAGERNVSISVGHAAEDGVILEQALEAAEICKRCEDKQQERKGNRKSAPWQSDRNCCAAPVRGFRR